MYNDDSYYENFGYGVRNTKNSFSLSNFNLKGKLILGLVVLVIIVIVLVIVNKISDYYNSYEYFEKQMVEKAKTYVTNNNIFVNDEIYLDMTKLNMNIKKSCSGISGVFVDKNYNYKGYLLCEDYETNIADSDASKVKLNGQAVVLLAKGINYTELGVNGYRNVNIQGEVGTEEGVYNLNYIVMDNNSILTTLTRKIVVVDNDYIKSLYPILTLKGEKIEFIKKGNQYIDSGIYASDSIDWDLTSKVKTTGTVNINTIGEYEIIYTVTNSRGYTNSITRKIVVVNGFSETFVTASLNNKNATNQDVVINLKVIGNDYDYMVLPNGNKSYSKDVTYKVSENGIYNFYSYDKDGKITTKIIPVNNINKEKPKASCNAQVYGTYTKIYVTPNSNNKISSYNYVVNGISSGEQISSNYDFKMNNIKNVNVVIKDSLGNTNNIICTMDMSKSYLREIYFDTQNGKNCLEGFTCYNQGDYRNPNVLYCSTETCGIIAERGCSITSYSTIISGLGIRKSDGTPYNPEELAVQHFNVVCSSHCSGTVAANNVAQRLGLSTTTHYTGVLKHKDVLIDLLKKGYPVLLTVGDNSVYTSGGHVMAILGINEQNEVFLSDPGTKRTTSAYNSKYKINSWVTIEEIARGAGGTQYFQAVCPAGKCTWKGYN